MNYSIVLLFKIYVKKKCMPCDTKGQFSTIISTLHNNYYVIIPNTDICIATTKLVAHQSIYSYKYNIDDNFSYYYCFLTLYQGNVVFSYTILPTSNFVRSCFGVPAFDSEKEDVSWWYNHTF